jgi:glycosyltransferase involved in cell wall biosynthesis
VGVVIDVVLPARDEAAALPAVLTALPPGYRAIVVDNGSSDGTAAVAAAAGAVVVPEPRPGYGAAVHSGLLRSESEVVCVMDADGSLDPGDLPRLVSLVLDGGCQLAIARRRPEAGAWSWPARLGNALLAHRLRSRGVPVHDIGPMRATRRDDLLALDVQDRRFGYPLELLLRASRAGWRITEVDVTYRARAAGTRSKVSGTVGGSLRAMLDFRKALA